MVVTTPPSVPAAEPHRPADTSAGPSKPVRKGPRRASAPVGSPAKKSQSAPALLVIDDSGMLVAAPESASFQAPTADANVMVDAGSPASARLGTEAELQAETSRDSAEAAETTQAVESEASGAEETPDESANSDDPAQAAPVEPGEEAANASAASSAATAGPETDAQTEPHDDDAQAEADSAEGSAEASGAEETPDESANSDDPAQAAPVEPGEEAANASAASSAATAGPETDAQTEPHDDDAQAEADSAEGSAEASGAEEIPDESASSDDPAQAAPAEESPEGSAEASGVEEIPDESANSDDPAQAAPVEEAPEGSAEASGAEEAPDESASSDDPAQAAPVETGEEAANTSAASSAATAGPETNAQTEPHDDDAQAEADSAEGSAKVSSAEDAPEGSAEASGAEDAAAPLSRRERRLAEQNARSGVELPKEANAAGATEEEVTEPAPPPTAAPAKRRNRFVLFLRGLLALLVTAVVVLSIGTVLSGEEEGSAGPSATEVSRQTAWDKSNALLVQAEELAKSATNKDLAAALTSTVDILRVQIAALDDGLPDSTEIPAAAATASSAPTVSALITGLESSANDLLANAATAEQAMGRVFAAAGTSQLLAAQDLGKMVGMQPAANALESTTFTAPQGPACSSTLEPRPGVTVDTALINAAVAEQKAVYAYQVAASRLPEPGFTQAGELLKEHQSKLGLLNAELTVRCLARVEPVAAYALDPAFTDTPESALAGLEAELATIYADVAALSKPAPLPEPLPSAESTRNATEVPSANNGLLREMSIAWLLESTAASRQWGGTLAPLAGMAP